MKQQMKIAEDMKKYNISISTDGSMKGDTYSFMSDNKKWVKSNFLWDWKTKQWIIVDRIQITEINEMVTSLESDGKSNIDILGEVTHRMITRSLSEIITTADAECLRNQYADDVVAKINKKFRKPSNVSESTWKSTLSSMILDYYQKNDITNNGTSSRTTTTESKPRPAARNASADTKAYWTKDDGEWIVMGPLGLKIGNSITIHKRDGSTQERIIGFVQSDGKYQVNSTKTYIDSKGCWECGNTERWNNSHQCTCCGEQEI